MSEGDPTKTVHFGREALTAAQKRAGLTDEQAARELGVGTRTWARWKASGQILYEHLTAVVLLLGLPEPDLPDGAPRTPWTILQGLEEISEAVGQLVAGLLRLEARLPPDGDQSG